jgi:RHS repeat-associated protein
VKYGALNATLAYANQSGQTSVAEWQYDAVGNRVQATDGTSTTTYTANAINQYTAISGTTPLAYSPRGDLTQLGDWSYTHDARGNLIRATNATTNTTASYWRDANGHRAVKDVNGTGTLYFNIGTSQLEAFNVTNATASSTIYEPGIDRPLAEVSSSGGLTFYHQDWLGSVVLLTSATGTKQESYTYDVWGKVTAVDASSQPVAAPQSRFLFTAREFDAETSLYHYRARAYSPSLGRFLQTDPIDFGGGDANLFRYGANNPVNFTDPSGLSAFSECVGDAQRDFYRRVARCQNTCPDASSAITQCISRAHEQYNMAYAACFRAFHPHGRATGFR